MDRLTLSRRPKIIERERCLPAGDGLPSWTTLPLDAKFPMVPNPKGSMVFCSTNLCETKHKSSRHYDFDLSDPYCHVFSNDYHPLHDRHLRNHFNQRQLRRHLRKNDFLTEDGKVVCTLKEFNRYRQYLRRVCLRELAREERIEKDKMIDAQREITESTDESPTDMRIRQVQEKLEKQRAMTRQRIEELLQEKANRLERRLGDMQEENTRRDLKRQEEDNKRQAAMILHHQQVKERNRRLLQRWKLRDRQHAKRMDERKRQQIYDHKKKSYEAWQTRKQIQKVRMEQEAEILRREHARREESITVRERMIAEQRNRITLKLEEMKERVRKEKEEREERYAIRLGKRLALAELRAWARHRGKRQRTRNARFRSTWDMGETMRRIIFSLDDSDLPQEGASSFLEMLSGAVDDLNVPPEGLLAEDEEGKADAEEERTTAEEEDQDFIIKEQARLIVDSVITKVRTELYPEYLKSLEEAGSPDDLDTVEKSVKFGTDRIINSQPRPSMDVESLRPVTEHVLTPVASLDYVSVGGGEDCGESINSDQHLVEKILNRLLIDLNDKRLSKDDLVKLTSYSLQILNSKEMTSPQDEEDMADLEVGDLYETAVANDLVHFTISKIVDEVKSGQVSREEMTGLALSVWDDPSSADEVVDNLIEETIQRIVSDKSFDRESSVHDFMLDEFIVKTLTEVSNDLKSGNLPMGVISQILQQMSEILGEVPINESDDQSETFKHLLERVTQDVLSECSDTLYRVVNIIITSYHTYRESSTQLLSELVADACSQLSTYLGAGEIQDSDIDFEALCGIAIKISPATMTSLQVCDLVCSIANILRIPTTPPNVDVDHIIRMSRGRINRTDVDSLTKIAHIIIGSCQHIVEGLGNEEVDKESGTQEVFLEDVSQFVVDILKLVSRSVDRGSFSESDIHEMTQLLQHVSRGNSLAPTPEPDKKCLLISTLASILDDVENGRVTEEEMQELGMHLRSCGEKLLGATPTASTETTMNRATSFTSTAVAENVVSHVLSSIQTDIDQDVMNKDSLKELAVCILKTRISKDKLQKDSDECMVTAVDSTHTHPSPCESRLAEDVVFATIDEIFRDLNEGILYPDKITSVASSAVSSLVIGSQRKQEGDTYEHTMNKVLKCLREDTIDREDAKKMFAMILDLYKSNWNTLDRDIAVLSSNSELAESLIRETLGKIERDIQSGAFTEAELQSLIGSGSLTEEREAADDVVNLILATIQEVLQNIDSGSISIDGLSSFLSLFRSQGQINPDELTMDIARAKCKEAARHISLHGGRSVYIKDITKFFGSDKDGSAAEPVAVLQSLLKVVDSNILTSFIRVTLQRVLSSIGSRSVHDQTQTQSSLLVRSDVHLQSATSLIAQNVVRNLMARIDHTLVEQGKMSSEDEILPAKLESRDYDYIQTLYENEPDVLMTYSSDEVGGMILDTLNNIVSNLRLHRSMTPSDEQATTMHTSSEILHDFVLQKLQFIVESMQDQVALGYKFSSGALFDNVSPEQSSEAESLLSMDDKRATSFISRVLQDVVHDISSEMSKAAHQQSTYLVNKQTSTLTLEVENIVAATLQDIVDDFTDAERQMSQKLQQEIVKRKALEALVQMKTDMMDGKDAYVKDAIIRIIATTAPDGENEPEFEFVEKTMDSIINNIEVDNIKASELYHPSTASTSGLITVGIDSSVDAASNGVDVRDVSGMDRPSVSLQKMLDMTNKMLKFHNEEMQRSGYGCKDSDCSFPSIQNSNTVTNMASAIKHSIDKTIDNLKEGNLGDEELVNLATALSQSMLDGDAEHVLSTTSIDASIEDFIIAMLEKKKREIESKGLDSKSIQCVTDRILDIQVRDQMAKREPEQSESVSSVSSSMLAVFVQDILQNIVCSLGGSSSTTGNNNVEELGKSESTETQNSDNGSISKQNINPNAVLPRISKRCSSSHIIPTKMDSFSPADSMMATEKATQSPNLPPDHKIKKDSTTRKVSPKTSVARRNAVPPNHHSTIPLRRTANMPPSTTNKPSPQTPPKRPTNPPRRITANTPPDKTARHLAQTKSSLAKSSPRQQKKQALPAINSSPNKQVQRSTTSTVVTEKKRKARKLNQNLSQAPSQDILKSERVRTSPCQKQVKEYLTDESRMTTPPALSESRQEEETSDKLPRRSKGNEDKKRHKPKQEVLQYEELTDLYLPTLPCDKSPIPMEIQSICGSHRTRIRVIKDNGDL